MNSERFALHDNCHAICQVVAGRQSVNRIHVPRAPGEPGIHMSAHLNIMSAIIYIFFNRRYGFLFIYFLSMVFALEFIPHNSEICKTLNIKHENSEILFGLEYEISFYSGRGKYRVRSFIYPKKKIYFYQINYSEYGVSSLRIFPKRSRFNENDYENSEL